MLNAVTIGDSEKLLRHVEADSVDLIVTDPPYGYSFMGKDWDRAVPSVSLWRECLRVLKPGGFAFVMSAPRSDVQAQMIVRMTEAGFRMDFTPIYHTYASGFPKALNIAKKLGSDSLSGSYAGFQPKPAVEVVLVAMKPLSEKTFIDQALANGKGVTWLDDARIPTEDNIPDTISSPTAMGQNSGWNDHNNRPVEYKSDGKRFPANLLVSDQALNDHSRFFSLDEWADTLPFLVVPKASKSEKGSTNNHPTVKPLRLMSYLITLGSRPGDVVVDPFLGSGTTAVAAKMLDRQYIGFEIEREYASIAVQRISAVRTQTALGL